MFSYGQRADTVFVYFVPYVYSLTVQEALLFYVFRFYGMKGRGIPSRATPMPSLSERVHKLTVGQSSIARKCDSSFVQ